MLYNKNGITITVSADGRNYMVEGKGFPISYHATLDKAVLKVAKHGADKKSDLWYWLDEYYDVAEGVIIDLRDDLSGLCPDVTYDASEENKCLVDPLTGFVEGSAEEEAYSTRGDR
jgi:hypothetical protein